MQPMTSAEKCANGAKARENMQLLLSARKQATGTKRGKTCNRCRAKKRAAGARHAKTCNQCLALKNVQPVLSTGKHETSAKR